MRMLDTLFGNETAEKVMLYLAAYGEGYARQIADWFGLPLYSVQQQLKRFENGGILASRKLGRTRVFTWNPRWPFREELTALLEAALEYLPPEEYRRWYAGRQRPRRTGKP